MNDIIFKVVEFNSDEHIQANKLRKEVLYEARGISTKDYSEEQNHIQIVGFMDNAIVATCSMVPDGGHCRMRYVAINSNMQGSGIGSKMLKFFEETAKNQGFKSIYCHARDTAIKFYSKNGFKEEGEMFEQVTIPHIKMRKFLI